MVRLGEGKNTVDSKLAKPQIRRSYLGGRANFPLCLAPMVGLSHVALRQLIREYLPTQLNTLWPTEMLSSRRLPAENLSRTAETLKLPQEGFFVPQILGNEEEPIRRSIEKLREWGAEGIDINMGCPVDQALRHNYGVALMGDASYAARVVEMAVRSSPLPVSVKLRSAPVSVGMGKDEEFLLNFCRGLIDAGASWLCLHPRTAEQKRRGRADWQQIRYLRAKIQVPLIGNGDIQCSEDVWSMLEQTNCDMVMAGRALAARPWMVWQIAEDLGYRSPLGKAPRTEWEEGAEYSRALHRMIDLCFQYFPPSFALRKIAFYLRTTHVWLEFGHILMASLSKAQDQRTLHEGVERFFLVPQRMSQRTELRQ